jgi:hypothetical protein
VGFASELRSRGSKISHENLLYSYELDPGNESFRSLLVRADQVGHQTAVEDSQSKLPIIFNCIPCLSVVKCLRS